MPTKITRAMSFSRPVLILLIVAVVAVGGLAAALGTSNAPPNACSVLTTTQSAPGMANSSSTSSTAYFTIIEADPGSNYEGMNGSAFHLSNPWPVIQVHQGQKVIIDVINCASSEPHGFAITHYFDSGATVRPGQSYTLTFEADQTGTFRMYCSIFCAIHAYMQNGELVVASS